MASCDGKKMNRKAECWPAGSIAQHRAILIQSSHGLGDSFSIALPEGLAAMPGHVARLTRIQSVRYLIAGFLLILTFMNLISASFARAQGGETEMLSVQKSAPAAVFIERGGSELELRRHLRAKNGVLISVPPPQWSVSRLRRPGALGSLPQSSWEWP